MLEYLNCFEPKEITYFQTKDFLSEKEIAELFQLESRKYENLNLGEKKRFLELSIVKCAKLTREEVKEFVELHFKDKDKNEQELYFNLIYILVLWKELAQDYMKLEKKADKTEAEKQKFASLSLSVSNSLSIILEKNP